MVNPKFSEIQKSQKAISKTQLGTIVWWSLSDNNVPRQKLLNLASDNNLDEKYLPPEVKPTSAFRRAWRHAISHLEEGLLLRPIVENDDAIVIGLVHETQKKSAKDLDYDLVVRIEYSKKNETLTFDRNVDFNTPEGKAVKAIDDLYQVHQSHDINDIRSIMTNFLYEVGIPLRESGGVYFVPAAYQQTLDSVCTVVKNCGRNSTYQLAVPDTIESHETLTVVAQSTLDSEIKQLQEQLDKLGTEDASVRETTWEKKLVLFDELRARVNLFAGVLNFKAEELTSKIGLIQAGIREKLGGPVKETPKRTKKVNIQVEAPKQPELPLTPDTEAGF